MTIDSSIPEPPIPADPTPPVTLVLTILLLVMFFAGFFSIYFCRCFMDNLVNSLNNRQTPNGTPVNPTPIPPGLDSSIVNSFPTFSYSSVKDYRREKYGLECAICLCEFDDNDILRLLNVCCHVFHQECIDLWFESHKSCPVCRRNLDINDDKQSPEKSPNVDNMLTNEGNNHANDINGDDSIGDAISIVIKDDAEDEKGPMPIKERSSSGGRRLESLYISERFSRSHSTGHSILKNLPREENDKYTLRLPEHIRETITRRHIVTLSCTVFGEFSDNSTKKHDCFGEISGCATREDVKNV